MITCLQIYNPKNKNKDCQNKIYCDNGGELYKYKINKKLEHDEILLSILQR